MTRLAQFYFDSKSCSGCKACQVACKDRHGLEAGRLWRRVYEVSGGAGWRAVGPSWQADLSVYNLSISCNHCEDPICVSVCPTGAMQQRPDGIVQIEAGRCIGCQYCAMACPYGAPQYDVAAGRMTKCDFCAEDTAAGRPPACVAACPMRALDYQPQGVYFTLEHNRRVLPPLPPADLTRPALWMVPHPSLARLDASSGRSGPRVANLEELGPLQAHDGPLAAFTVLAPMLVGLFVWLGLAYFWIEGQWGRALAYGLLGNAFSGLALGMGLTLAVSLLHLGRPLQALRAAANLHTSWLSREIWFAAPFCLGSLVFAWLIRLPREPYSDGLFSLTAACGLALVYCIGRVYRLRTVSVWNSPITQLNPALTCLGLGGLGAGWVLAAPGATGEQAGLTAMSAALALLGWLGLAVNLALAWRENRRWGRHSPGLLRPRITPAGRARLLQLRLALVAGVAAALAAGWPLRAQAGQGFWLLLALALGAAAELVGRVLFYRARPA